MLYVDGVNVNNLWRGQKAFFDAIRLMGYADYDVGIKEITSTSSTSPDVPYAPEAWIKNFGRENADDFLCIAEIEDTTGIAYLDTIPYTLPADTEDTVAFAPCTLSAGHYTLRVRTVMDPDECDEDDEMCIQLDVTGIGETPAPEKVSFDVTPIYAGEVLKVSFETPKGQLAVLALYNSAGQRVETLHVTGSGQVCIGKGLSAGVYFVRLEAETFTLTRKAVKIR